MEKRYQVFISSTFQDLHGARQAVSEALLRANCFPAGMELFPAADAEQFEFIKSVIDQSDYYLLISAGRYGSIHPETGLSYTEMEYDYAVASEAPVIRLLHKDPFNALKGEYIEPTDDGRKKLRAFRDKLTGGSLVRFWSDPKDLMAETVFALQDIQKRKPATGWVRSDRIAQDAAELQIARLQARVSELELENARLPEAVIDVEQVFADIEGETEIKFPRFDEVKIEGLRVEGAEGEERYFVPMKELCWALATAMTNSFVDNAIVLDAIRLLDARALGKWSERQLYVDDEQLAFRRAFAYLRERRVAEPQVLAGFTEGQAVQGDGIGAMLARYGRHGATFSQRTTWSLSEAAAVSASNWYVKLTGQAQNSTPA
ncbi:DUF4062 domain-containing protein [Thioclava nitratireducens]|uniref:DUF4062 domain-containing protein n=1 Tax=Thioclava nitratireducens TaxID=1915078 RepID=UPI0024816FBC|nr:DUF4062 domain-containing protein [Thioclava nitratireducens]WGT51415.1 DUF4062 domain-containing protein [Thioclava nitratireducens]